MRNQATIILLFLGITMLSSCYISRAIRFRNFELKDLDKHISDTIFTGNQPFSFHQGLVVDSTLSGYINRNLEGTETYSFMVIRRDTILYEYYNSDYDLDKSSILPVFSVAKSFVSTLVAIALEEGKIGSLQDSITRYIPELLQRDHRFGQITVQHVLDMRSGIKSNENYADPSSEVLKLGFGSNIWNVVKRLRIKSAPGEFEYLSANTQILGIIVERATGKKLQDYLEEKIWQPLGMESYATWNIDNKKDRMVRAFCCINATTRDMAKLGRLYLHNGNWNGKQILSAEWVRSTTSLDTFVNYEGYKNQWWTYGFTQSFLTEKAAVEECRINPYCIPVIYTYEVNKGKPDYKKFYYIKYLKRGYHAEGLLGQYIYVNPDKELIIVRTGHGWKHPKFYAGDTFIYYLAEHYL